MEHAARLGLADPGLFAAAWEGDMDVALKWARELDPSGDEDVIRAIAEELVQLHIQQSYVTERVTAQRSRFGPIEVALHAAKRTRKEEAAATVVARG